MGSSCTSTLERPYLPRTQVFTDSLNPGAAGSALYAIAGLPVSGLTVLQQACGSINRDFPEQEKELRELSGGLPARCADKSRMAATP